MHYTANKCRMCLQGKETLFCHKGLNARSVESKSNMQSIFQPDDVTACRCAGDSRSHLSVCAWKECLQEFSFDIMVPFDSCVACVSAEPITRPRRLQ